MWNDPDLDTQRDRHSRPQRSRGRTRRGSGGGKRQTNGHDQEEELIAFGYEAFIFRNDGVAEAIEHGQLMITWQGQDPSDESAMWLDRYDGRNLLDSERLFSGPRELYDEHILYHDDDDSELDQERFADLDSDEELLFDMDEDERKEFLEEKRQAREPSNYTGIGYDYGETEGSAEPSYQIHFEVPDGMVVPDSQKVLALIERTAKFVNNSSEPTMEIILQAKQATNPNFAFMSRRHPLFQFYKHVRWLMQTGLYETEEEFRQREEEEVKAEQEAADQRSLKASRDYKDKEYPHADIEEIIEKTIDFLLLSEHASVFERVLLESNDLRFGFIRKNHIWHQHYASRRSIVSANRENFKTPETQPESEPHIDTSESQLQQKISGVISEKTTVSQTIGQNSGVSHLSEAEISAKESRATEMRRLDRLQRIKELFQQKHKTDETMIDSKPNQTNPQNDERAEHSSGLGSRSRERSMSRSRSSSPSGYPSPPPRWSISRPDSG